MKLTLKTHGGQATGHAGNLTPEDLASTPTAVQNRKAVLKTRRRTRNTKKRRRAPVKLTVQDLQAFVRGVEEPLELPSTKPTQHSMATKRQPARNYGQEEPLEMPSTWDTPRGKPE